MTDVNTFDTRSVERISNVVRSVEGTRRDLTGQPGRRKPTIQGTILAEITASGATAGFYKAKQKVWDGSAFIDFPLGRLWNGTSLPEVFDVNGTTGIADGTIVFLTRIGDTAGGFQWVIISNVGTSTFPVKITSKESGSTYRIDVFADGSDQPATETGETIIIMQIDSSQTVPSGTFLLAVKIGTTFYGQVPIWL